MKEHHQRKLERIASELDGHLFIKEHKDWHGRRVRRVGFDYVPEEFKEDWEGTDDWAEEFESARLESIARAKSWLKEQQEAAIRKK